MQFALTQEQSLLKDAVDKFVRDRYGDHQRRAYRAQPRGFAAENWRLLADLGVLALPFVIEDDGFGGGPRDLMTVMEALGRGFVVEPVLEEILLAGGVLAALADPTQKRRWLPKIMAGEAHLALAHFEHGARFNLSHVTVSAKRRGPAFILNGEKSVVPLGGGCDQWIVSAREHGDATARNGIGFFLVSPDAAGIERRDFRLIDGSWASRLRMQDVATVERLPGGYIEFAGIIDGVRLACGAEMVGIMSTLFDSTLDYLRTRRQFGAPLASFQALQHRLADLYVRLEQSRSHLHRAALCMQGDIQRERAVAGMKSYVSRAAIEIGEECIHLHGGIGTTDDLAVGHGYKRLLVLASLFGDANAELVRFCRLASRTSK